MDTISETKLETLTVKASDFNNLLLGVSVGMDKGKGASSTLGSLYLVATGNSYLSASASDKYRLIEGRFNQDINYDVEGEGESARLEECQIRANDVKNILATIKANKVAGDITLTRLGDNLKLSIGSTSLNVIVGCDKFPPYEHLFNNLEITPISRIMLNPTYLASFDKVPASDEGNTFTFYGERKPVGVTINHKRIEWRALLMPMQIR